MNTKKKRIQKSTPATIETHVICPHCGQEIAIADKEHLAVGHVIGKDSALGTIVLPPAEDNKHTPKNKAEARLDALRKAGVDTTGLFSLQGAAGDGILIRMGASGTPEVVPDNDPIFAGIIDGGFIPEQRLFRRWVMAQTYRMLISPTGYTESVHQKGYAYQWRMLLNELEIQQKLMRRDKENFAMRTRWFNHKLVKRMAEDMNNKVINLIEELNTHKFKGTPYKDVPGFGKILVKDLHTEVFDPLYDLILNVNRANNHQQLTEAVRNISNSRFMRTLRKASQSSYWMNAYKGAGAYFTLRNMILFHGCGLKINKNADSMPGQAESLNNLEKLAEKYSTCGWRLFGVLRKAITDNGINIEAKRREWAEQKRLRLSQKKSH